MKQVMMLTLLGVMTGTVLGQAKIGYVDSQKLIGSLKETQTVQTQLQAEQEKAYKQMYYLQDSLQAAQEDYVKNIKDNPLLKDGAKKAIEKGIQELAAFLQTTQQRLQEELVQKQNELMQPILDKVKKAVENVRKAQTLDLILDSGYGIVLASDPKLDLTDKTLEELVKMGTEKIEKTGKQ